MDLKDLSIVVSLAVTAGGGGWWMSNHFASAQDVQVTSIKADYALDKHMEYVIAQIALFEAKIKRGQPLSDTERDQLNFLRQELERMRAIRQGK